MVRPSVVRPGFIQNNCCDSPEMSEYTWHYDAADLYEDFDRYDRSGQDDRPYQNGLAVRAEDSDGAILVPVTVVISEQTEHA
ncbi:hypothetical protein SERLA73DRAFT_77319 [Serpula lacrymans var. lacrymans S7.3]|uniref:Uncharacterized protein n=1 Tax=Serpula lacrymans var. lacrymans (strain S7.3) TaxID=936435 RepID=F8Q9P6_SERL3|nr:hypothetical protein SERLA73DRAFT_77319 [Serpula lacrymans var. lacrymans S7.3]